MTKKEMAEELVSKTALKDKSKAIEKIIKMSKERIEWAMRYLDKGVEPDYIVFVLTGCLAPSKMRK